MSGENLLQGETEKSDSESELYKIDNGIINTGLKVKK